MIPSIQILTQDITETTYASRTYRIVFNTHDLEGEDSPVSVQGLSLTNDSTDYDRVSGYVDDVESVMQAIYLILSTERYEHIIYSWDYGVELVDLFGKPIPYVIAELPRRIKEALIQDNRIDDVVDFEFEHHGHKLHTTFTAITNVGNITANVEVNV